MCWKKACILLLFFAVTAIVSPAQTVTTLAAFEQTNGATPRFGSVVQATNGDLYGTTEAGGSNNYGTIFEITPAGVLTTLHSFNLTDGANPTAALVQATNGDLYGTASLGGTGTACGRTGCGTIFKITVAGALTTLYNFDMTDGTAPGFGENLTKGLIDTFGDTGHPVLSAQTVPASDIGTHTPLSQI